MARAPTNQGQSDNPEERHDAFTISWQAKVGTNDASVEAQNKNALRAFAEVEVIIIRDWHGRSVRWRASRIHRRRQAGRQVLIPTFGVGDGIAGVSCTGPTGVWQTCVRWRGRSGEGCRLVHSRGAAL